MGRFLIYGANGYTGRLVAEQAVAEGLTPVLGGRRVSAIAPMGERLGLAYRVFDLGDTDHAVRSLEGIDAVLHCAGPFTATSRPMLDACVRAGVHYLDITGEIEVFEAVHHRSPELARRGVVAVPGVGFDVVPTDGLAALLAEALPSATQLELAFAVVGGGTSRGTARTAVEGLRRGGAARVGGRIVRVPVGWRTRRVPLGGRERDVVSVPWGDVSTAWYTTGIPDVTVYTAVPRAASRALRWGRPVQAVLGTAPVQGVLRRLIDARVTGPTAEQRAEGRSFVWGRVEDHAGRAVEGHVTAPEGYRFTVLSSLAAVRRVLDGGVAPGAHTPSRAFGLDFLGSLPEVEIDPLRRLG